MTKGVNDKKEAIEENELMEEAIDEIEFNEIIS